MTVEPADLDRTDVGPTEAVRTDEGPTGVVELHPVRGLPEVVTGTDLAALIHGACAAHGPTLRAGDVVVVSSKIVSKSAGLRRPHRDDAIAEATVRVVAERRVGGRHTRIVEAVAGPVMAAAGVDASNTGGGDDVLVLPADADAAAATILAGLHRLTGLDPGQLAVVVTDTAGRPWRVGQTDFALGSACLRVLDDLRGSTDADGRPLAVTARAVGDEVAAAADLVKGKANAVPVAVVRGLGQALDPDAPAARSLARTGPGDWFALGHVEAVRAALGVAPGGTDSHDVGIADASPEPLVDRARRAVRLARCGEALGPVRVSADGAEVGLGPTDAYAAGRFVARLEAALWAESLRIANRSTPPPTGPVSLRLTVAER